METPPPNFTQYPRGSFGHGGGAPYRGPGVYFDYINVAFRMITKNAGVYVLGSFLILAVFYGVIFMLSFVSNFLSYGSAMGPKNIPPDQLLSTMLRATPISILVNVVPGALFYMMFTGVALCAVEELDTGSTSFNTLFKGFDNFWNTFMCCLLMYFSMTIGMYLCCIPMFVLGGLFSFVPIISATEKVGVGASFSKAIELVKPFILPMTGLYLVCTLLGGLGVCACLVGVLFTFPILYVVIGMHYRDFRGPSGRLTF